MFGGSQHDTNVDINARPIAWNQLPIGAGGWLRAVEVNPDGTVICRADTYGAYVYDPATGRWRQLITTSSMPASAQGLIVDGTGGVYAVCSAPSNSNRIYMTYNNQIYRSDDKGLHFILPSPFGNTMSPNNGGAAPQLGPKMAVDPINPDVVIVITDNQGAFYSIDAGATWTQISGVASNSRDGVCCCCFDPSGGTSGGKTNVVILGISGIGLYRSTTGANGTFTSMSTAFTNPSRLKTDNSGNVYICLNDASQLLKMTGTTIVDITPTSFGSNQIDNVLIDPNTPGHITAFTQSCYLVDSTDYGATWPAGANFFHTRVSPDIPYLQTLFPAAPGDQTFNFIMGDIVQSPIDGKIWMTGGQSIFTTPVIQPVSTQVWTSNAKGIEQLVASQIIVPPGLKPLVISWDTGVLVSPGLAQFPDHVSWATTIEVNRATGADFAKNNPNYIAVVLNQFEEDSGFSTDGGQTFTKFTTAPTTGNGGSIAVATSTNMVWAPGNNGDLWNTKNGGTTWTKRTPTGVPTSPSETGWGFDGSYKKFIVIADDTNIGTFYVYNYGPGGASGVKGVWKSTDGGDTWTQIYSNWFSDIPSSGDNSFNCRFRQVPGQPGVMFFTGGPQGGNGDVRPHNQSFWKFTDIAGTVTATRVNIANGFSADVLEVWDFCFGKAAPGSSNPTMYIYGWVNGVGGIWESRDLGQTWIQISGLYPTGWLDTLCAMAGDPNLYGILLLGFFGSGYGYGKKM